MTGRWYLVALCQIVAVYMALEKFSLWLIFIVLPFIVYCYFQKKKGRFYFFVILSSFFCFFSYTLIFDYFNTTHLAENEKNFIGTIATIPIIDGDRMSFQFAVNGERVQVQYYLQSLEEKEQLENMMIGMMCKITGDLKHPSTPTNFYAFNYAKYLYYDRIHWLLSPTSLKIENCLPTKNNPLGMLQNFRQKGIQFINENFPEELKGIAAALIYGHRHFIEENVLDAYQSLGVVHLLAVSGLHVGFIVSALYYIFLRIGLTKERVYELLIAILPIYAILAGAAPSAIRASFMTMVVLICLRLKKRLHPLDGISWIFIGYLIWNPYILFHIGFQLSFLISYSLILSAQTIFSRFSGYIKPLMAVTIQSQFVALPIIFYNFYEISLLSVPLNMIYIPFIALFVLPSVFILFFISVVFPPLATIFLAILEHILLFAHQLLAVLQQIPLTMITVGKISSIVVCLLFTIIIFACYRLEKYKHWKALLFPCILFVAVIIIIKMVPYFNPNGEVTFIDVGQGDSILIELPHRRAVYLIDTGGQLSFYDDEWRKKKREFNVGKDVVTPYLKAKGISTIHKLILTHGDFDHVGGAEEIVKAFNVKQVYYPIGNVDGEYERELLTSLFEQNGKIHFVREGESWQVGKQLFYVLSPTGSEQTTNDRSIVIYAHIGGIKWLFTGDLEEAGEKRLINDYKNLHVDILKAGHHGSKTSSSPEFLAHIKPKAAVISVGRNNRYQHPHEEVLDAFRHHNVKVYRTDEQGAIRFILNGKRLKKVENAKKDCCE